MACSSGFHCPSWSGESSSRIAVSDYVEQQAKPLLLSPVGWRCEWAYPRRLFLRSRCFAYLPDQIRLGQMCFENKQYASQAQIEAKTGIQFQQRAGLCGRSHPNSASRCRRYQDGWGFHPAVRHFCYSSAPLVRLHASCIGLPLKDSLNPFSEHGYPICEG